MTRAEWLSGAGVRQSEVTVTKPSERFPTEVRATATGFCYHQGAIFGGLVGPVLAYFATSWHMGFAIPMMIGTTVAAGSVFVAMLFSPETKGTQLVSDIQLV